MSKRESRRAEGGRVTLGERRGVTAITEGLAEKAQCSHEAEDEPCSRTVIRRPEGSLITCIACGRRLRLPQSDGTIMLFPRLPTGSCTTWGTLLRRATTQLHQPLRCSIFPSVRTTPSTRARGQNPASPGVGARRRVHPPCGGARGRGAGAEQVRILLQQVSCTMHKP